MRESHATRGIRQIAMKNVFQEILLIVSLIALSACAHEPDPTVVIEGEYDDTFVRMACITDKIPAPSCENLRSDMRSFERVTMTEAQARETCAGIIFTRSNSSKEESMSPLAAHPNNVWHLEIEYVGSQTKAGWIMFSPAPAQQISEGSGNSAGIAAAVCSIVKARGAVIR